RRWSISARTCLCRFERPQPSPSATSIPPCHNGRSADWRFGAPGEVSGNLTAWTSQCEAARKAVRIAPAKSSSRRANAELHCRLGRERARDAIRGANSRAAACIAQGQQALGPGVEDGFRRASTRALDLALEHRAGNPCGGFAFAFAQVEVVRVDQAPGRGVEIFRIEQGFEGVLVLQMRRATERGRGQLHQVPGVSQRVLDPAEAVPRNQLDPRKPQAGLEWLYLVPHAFAPPPQSGPL